MDFHHALLGSPPKRSMQLFHPGGKAVVIDGGAAIA
jgi:hypothetical protein